MRLDKDYFDKDTLDLAQDLIGKVFVYESSKGVIKGIINETEAYNEEDESCHAFKGNRTKRNEVMFWEAGHFYIYFTYGMYYCSNIVSGPSGKGEAVLIRSVIPIEGEDIMRENRNWSKKGLKGLCDGPAKFCMAYGFDKKFNGLDLLDRGSGVYVEDLGYKPKKVFRTQRIGISKSTHLDWRFVGEF
jgi:DNA-3-methyladenine glycosylase